MTHIHSPECKDLLGKLSNYIDGELDNETCEKLREHMAGCENCQLVFDTTTRTIYLYKTVAGETELPTDVRGRLFETLKLDDLLQPRS